MNQLPVVCLTCRRTYKHIEVNHPLLFKGEHASGICPACLNPVDAKLFGRSPLQGALDEIKSLDATADVETYR